MRETLENALVTDEEFALATAQKKKFDSFLRSVREEKGIDGLAQLTEETVRANTGGLTTGFDSFRKLADPFFDGESVEQFMEFNPPEEDEEEGEEEEQSDADMEAAE